MISQELAKAKSYYLDTETFNEKEFCVKVTLENVAKVEAMIAHDAAYSRSFSKYSHPDEQWKKQFDVEAGTPDPCKDYSGYRGSSAFWFYLLTEYCKNILKCGDIVWEEIQHDFYWNLGITQAIYREQGREQELSDQEIIRNWREVFRKKFPKDSEYFRFLIYNAICSIDVENSAHLNSDGVGSRELTDRIVKNESRFCDLVKNDNKDYELIDILSERTTPKDSQHYGRENFSFATKFCHYAAFYIFENTNYQDNYSIFDSVISNVLSSVYCNIRIGNVIYETKWSAAYEKLKNNKKYNVPYSRTYGDYQGLIDSIRKTYAKQTGEEVSRNGFDHLLWYYYKGRGAELIK